MHKIEVVKLEEAGYRSAMIGLSYNKKQVVENMPHVAGKLHNRDGGHNKFLEHIVTWWEITAPRYWWQEMDTYRIGVSKQSESTTYTLVKDIKRLAPRGLIKLIDTSEDEYYDILDHLHTWFEDGSFNNDDQQLNALVDAALQNDMVRTKQLLPEGFLQKRECVINYKTLRNMILQRKNHPLPHWQKFCHEVRAQVEHPKLLP